MKVVTNFPIEGLDAFVKKLVEGAAIPGEYKKRKKKPLAPIPDAALLPIAFSTGRAAYSTVVQIGGESWTVSFTQHNLRVWVNADWNRDSPTFQGHAVRSRIVRAVEEIRVRQFLSPEQAGWLAAADVATGILANATQSPGAEGSELEWITELRRDHDLIQPGEVSGVWTLTADGWDVWRYLTQRERLL